MTPLNTELKESRRKEDFKYYIALPTPSETQMRSAVKGNDRYTPSSSPVWKLALALALIFGAIYAAFLFYGSGQ